MAHEVIPTVGIVLHDRLDALQSATIPDWISQRIGKWTSSQIGKLFVKPREKNKLWSETSLSYIKQIAHEVLSGEPTPEIIARSIEYGRANEREGYIWYATYFNDGTKQIDYYGIENPKFFLYKQNAGGSPDGLINNDGILEIKCPSNTEVRMDYMLLKSADDLFDYNKMNFYQAQANLLFIDRQYVDFCIYDPSMIKPEHRMKVIKIYRNEEIIKEIDKKIDEATEVLMTIIDSFNCI